MPKAERAAVPGAADPLAGFLACLWRGGRLFVTDCGKAVVELPDGKSVAEVGADILDEAEAGKLLDLSGERVRLTRKGRLLAEAWADRWHKAERRKPRTV